MAKNESKTAVEITEETPVSDAMVSSGQVEETPEEKVSTDVKDDFVEAFVLCDCLFGRAGDIVKLKQYEADVGVKAGIIDTHPDAVRLHRHDDNQS